MARKAGLPRDAREGNQLHEVFQEIFARRREYHPANPVGYSGHPASATLPACRDLLTPILYFKGFHALTCYRFGHHLWKKGRVDLALYLFAKPDFRSVCPWTFIRRRAHRRGHFARPRHRLRRGRNVSRGGQQCLDPARGDARRHGQSRRATAIPENYIAGGADWGWGEDFAGNIVIGTGAKISANSVVLHDVPPHAATVAGVTRKNRRPARREAGTGAGDETRFGQSRAVLSIPAMGFELNIHKGKMRNRRIFCTARITTGALPFHFALSQFCLQLKSTGSTSIVCRTSLSEEIRPAGAGATRGRCARCCPRNTRVGSGRSL